jgi:hypothetical protein
LQVGEIGACDEQNDNSQPHRERGNGVTEVIHARPLEINHPETILAVVLWIFPVEAGGQAAHLGVGLGDGNAGFEPRDDLQPVVRRSCRKAWRRSVSIRSEGEGESERGQDGASRGEERR